MCKTLFVSAPTHAVHHPSGPLSTPTHFPFAPVRPNISVMRVPRPTPLAAAPNAALPGRRRSCPYSKTSPGVRHRRKTQVAVDVLAGVLLQHVLGLVGTPLFHLPRSPSEKQPLPPLLPVLGGGWRRASRQRAVDRKSRTHVGRRCAARSTLCSVVRFHAHVRRQGGGERGGGKAGTANLLVSALNLPQ